MGQYTRRAMITIFATALSAGSASLAAAESARESLEPTSRAQSHETTSKRQSSSGEAPASKAKNYDFVGDEIDGDRVRPDGTTIFGMDAVQHQGLIRLRQHFIPDIIESAEWL